MATSRRGYAEGDRITRPILRRFDLDTASAIGVHRPQQTGTTSALALLDLGLPARHGTFDPRIPSPPWDQNRWKT